MADTARTSSVVDRGSTERALIVSSDGHVSAQMADYRPYLPARTHEEFDEFCERYRREGSRNFEPQALRLRTDDDVVAAWVEEVIDAGRVAGLSDPTQRLAELEREGVVAEVLFPDFGLPFELYSPFLAARLGFSRTQEQIELGYRAHNRWLADFCRDAPGRLVGLAAISFSDVDETVREVRWARDAGLAGVVLPSFDDDDPLFDARYEPIWDVLEELGMTVNCHTAISSITQRMPAGAMAKLPVASLAIPLLSAQNFFFSRQMLSYFIWGGVLDRHPYLQLVLTEQGSGWVVDALESMDYTYESSYLRRDVRDVVRLRPSEYFERQGHLGSSLLSRAEMRAREAIGVGKLMVGIDYPHLEGTWGVGPGTFQYLRATLGAAGVPPDDARRMLGGNAVALYGLDRDALDAVAQRVGPILDDVLTAPAEDLYARGDVNKPLGGTL